MQTTSSQGALKGCYMPHPEFNIRVNVAISTPTLTLLRNAPSPDSRGRAQFPKNRIFVGKAHENPIFRLLPSLPGVRSTQAWAVCPGKG
jgi:hypothetical protein